MSAPALVVCRLRPYLPDFVSGNFDPALALAIVVHRRTSVSWSFYVARGFRDPILFDLMTHGFHR